MNELLAARSNLDSARLKGLQQSQSLSNTNTQTKAQRKNALMAQARKFEGFFVNMLLTSMRKTVQKSEMFDGGQAEQIFTSMFDQAISDEAAKHGQGMGIAQMIYRQLAPLAEQSRQVADRLAKQSNVDGGTDGR